MDDTRHIPPFKTEDGLHIAQLPNGGWLVRTPETGMMMPKPLAAFSTPDELITALERAIGSPTELPQVCAKRIDMAADAHLPESQTYLLQCRDSFFYLIGDAMAEAQRAMVKFPQPNYVISKFAEESGEVVKAAIHCAEGRETAENVRGEMKQAIAMLYRLWVEGDEKHGLAAMRPSRD